MSSKLIILSVASTALMVATMHAKNRETDWLRAQYEGQTLERIQSELRDLLGFLVVP